MKHTIFRQDTTIRLSCRTGDYLLWCRYKGGFSQKNDQYEINDIWQLSDGDFITITNRGIDLPSWFELHPLEVSNSLIYWMQRKLEAGYKPNDIVDNSHIWRVFAGDRLVWVGKQRSEVECDNGVLSIFTFNENAAIVGESYMNCGDVSHFGEFDQERQSEEDIILCRTGWNAILKLGSPRSASANGEWKIG